MWDHTQRSYHNHGIPSLINSAYLHLSSECFNHSPIIEVLWLLQDGSGLQMCIRRSELAGRLSASSFENFELFGVHVGFLAQTALQTYSWSLRLSCLGGRVASGFQFRMHFPSVCVCAFRELAGHVHFFGTNMSYSRCLTSTFFVGAPIMLSN